MPQTDPKYLRVKVIPKSPQSKLVEEMADGTLKIRIAAPPEKGKANLELIKFLSQHFDYPKNQIRIVSGKNDPLKLIKLG